MYIMKQQTMLRSRTWQWVGHRLTSCAADHILCLISRHGRPMPEGVHHVPHLREGKSEPWYQHILALPSAQRGMLVSQTEDKAGPHS